ncbi:Lrp/AsnC family transcriptional regulator [Candidatus Micrarchaeota archaeon]|nr:Lrp/AsnC family transcriptional regulator [Candidatus Micrarchaeota archaeon]
MVKLDELDSLILKILRQNSNLSNNEIGKQVNLSEAGVRKRISKLIETGTIKKFTIETSEEHENISAITLVAVDPNSKIDEIANQIKLLEGVKRVYEITGSHDIAAFITNEDIEKVNRSIDLIRNIPHVHTTDTKIILKSHE